MLRLLSVLAVAVLAVTGFSGNAKAEPHQYEFDKAHTQIVFFADHMGFSKSSGKFLDFDGHYVFDQENPENSSVEVTIQTSSINMDLERWDDHMKNEDFFNVEKYPTMVFKSTEVKVTGEDTADVTGDLTMLDVTKPVTMKVKFNKAGPHFRDTTKQLSGFSATAELDRGEWGMSYGLPMMSPVVEIRIEVEGFYQTAEAAEEGEAAE